MAKKKLKPVKFLGKTQPNVMLYQPYVNVLSSSNDLYKNLRNMTPQSCYVNWHLWYLSGSQDLCSQIANRT